jgi:lipase
MRSHADDCAAVVEAVASGPVTVIGESMGGFVAVVLAARRPDLVARLVLVDGGLPPRIPDDIDIDRVLEAVLGPALARLSQTFSSEAEYLEFWRRHPALANDWNGEIEAYLDYDLEPVEGGFRSRASESAVRHDGAEVLIDPSVVEGALREVRCPVHLIRATRNLLDQLPPLIGDEAVDRWRGVLPHLTEEVVPDTNHYSLMLGDRGARLIARRASNSGVTA